MLQNGNTNAIIAIIIQALNAIRQVSLELNFFLTAFGHGVSSSDDFVFADTSLTGSVTVLFSTALS